MSQSVQLSERALEARRRYQRERWKSKQGQKSMANYWERMADRYEAQDRLAELNKRQPRSADSTSGG